MTHHPPLPEKKPWPISWVILSILAFMIFYTLIMAFFRKQQDPFFPFEEAQSSQMAPLLKSEGWEIFTGAMLTGSFRENPRFVFSPREGIELQSTEASALVEVTLDDPHIPLLLDSVIAPTSIRADEPYQAELHWVPTDPFEHPARLYFFTRDDNIIILPPHGRGRQTAEATETPTYLFIPPEHLAPGTYFFHFYSEGSFSSWELTVSP